MSKASRKKKEEVVEHVLNVLSNDPQKWKFDLLEMFLQGAIYNQIGYMDALNKNTGVTERLLVGIEPNANGTFSTYPLARLLEADEINNYIAPDGKGGWDELEVSE